MAKVSKEEILKAKYLQETEFSRRKMRKINPQHNHSSNINLNADMPEGEPKGTNIYSKSQDVDKTKSLDEGKTSPQTKATRCWVNSSAVC